MLPQDIDVAAFSHVSFLLHIDIHHRSKVYHLFLLFAGDAGEGFPNIDIDFRTNAEFGQIDARFYGKAAPGDDQALVMRFKIVHISAGTMNFGAYAMAGAVKKVFAVVLLLDIATDGVIDFEAGNGGSLRDAIYHELRSTFASIADDGEDVLDFIRYHVTTESSPGDVVIDCVGFGQFGEEVDE